MSAILWFRKGLRLHDNPALIAAIKEDLHLLPVFVLDPSFVSNDKVNSNRCRFLQQSLTDLNSSIKAIGSRLLILRGKPEEVFIKYFEEFKVKVILWEHDTEPSSKERDKKVENIAKSKGIKVVIKHGHTLYEAERILEANEKKVPLTYQSMQTVISKLGAPPQPVDAPGKLPASCFMKSKIISDAQFNIPTLKELGVDESSLNPCLYPGGETEALKRLLAIILKKPWIHSLDKPKTSLHSLQTSTSTVLGPYLKFGCISCRFFYFELKKGYESEKPSQEPVSLKGELFWREYFYTVGALSPNFDRMEGNPICKSIPWVKNDKWLEAWKLGKTGYPFIDALMTQLRLEGWIHFSGRNAVACFLTRGDLWQPWEEGMKVFEEYLIDADWSINAGYWMWVSASCFFTQFFKVNSPVACGKKTDEEGEFIRKYIPGLAKFPSKYIYEPWKAPRTDQEEAGCIIGEDYPRPIVYHEIQKRRNMSKMSKAYKDNKGKRPMPDITDSERSTKKV